MIIVYLRPIIMENNIKTTEEMITWEDYVSRFETLLKSSTPENPYDNKDYFNYLKLNNSRQKRWLKTAHINSELEEKIKAIDQPLTWIVITEPWCGDAAHTIPYIKLAADLNPLIKLRFMWRDQPPYLIESYLTNGGKSVPKLIVRDEENRDIFNWGPRPEPCQRIYMDLKAKNADFETQKITLQEWYNRDKGATFQQELLDILITAMK